MILLVGGYHPPGLRQIGYPAFYVCMEQFLFLLLVHPSLHMLAGGKQMSRRSERPCLRSAWDWTSKGHSGPCHPAVMALQTSTFLSRVP